MKILFIQMYIITIYQNQFLLFYNYLKAINRRNIKHFTITKNIIIQ